MISNLLKKVFGSRNDRLLKTYRGAVAKVNALESALSSSATNSCAAKTERIQGPPGKGRNPRRAPAGSLRRRAGSRQAGPWHAPLRRPADRRHGPAPGQDFRNAHRRGQDPDGHPAGLPERPVRQGRAHHHRERLPGQPRRGMDGPHLPLPGHQRRLQPVPDAARGKTGRLRRRHHLRHQQRVRLRLPARQHGVHAVATGAAQASTTPSSTRWTRSSSTRRARR
jgi:hypothetical protein